MSRKEQSSAEARPLATGEANPTTESPSGGPPACDSVDWSTALRSVGGDRELLKEVTEAFLTEGKGLLERLCEAVRQADAVVVARSAHTLKSSLNYFGARKGFALALQLERMGRESDLEGIAEPLSEFKEQMGLVMTALEASVGS